MTVAPQSPLAGGSAEIESVPGAVPVPLMVAVLSVLAPALMSSAALSAPCDCGVKRTLTEQLAPAAIDLPAQPSVTMLNDDALTPAIVVAESGCEAASP